MARHRNEIAPDLDNQLCIGLHRYLVEDRCRLIIGIALNGTNRAVVSQSLIRVLWYANVLSIGQHSFCKLGCSLTKRSKESWAVLPSNVESSA